MNIHIFHVTHNDLCLAAAGHETSLENLSSSVFRIYLFQASSIITIVLEVIMENLVCGLDVTFGMPSSQRAFYFSNFQFLSYFDIQALVSIGACDVIELDIQTCEPHIVRCSSNTQEEE